MNKKELLAYEYALKLIDKKDIEIYLGDDEFQDYLTNWQKKVDILAKKQALHLKPSEVIWQKIQTKITAQKPKKHSAAIGFNQKLAQFWHNIDTRLQYGVPAFASLVFALSLILSPPTEKLVEKFGWDIKTSAKNLSLQIDVTTHEHPYDTKTCRLWVKNNEQYSFIGNLPITGNKSLSITAKQLSLIESGEVVISLEDSNMKAKDMPNGSIEHQGVWREVFL